MTTPRKTSWATAALVLLLAAAPVAAQTGTITGTVRTEDGRPLAGVQMSIPGTTLGTLTRGNGSYLMLGVPQGTHELRAELIGYTTVIREVTVQAGETRNVDFALESSAIALDEIIVTGVAGATERVKVPFDVAQLRTEDLPVPAVSAASAIQGKVAGATVVQGSGRPGSAPSILLRGATSISASGRDQEPLYIVDGVILGESMVDIDALDIESIEVIKGAAASSLYGSRAGNGVISITTRRGKEFADGQVRYTVRSTVGTSDLPGRFPMLRRTFWALNADGTRFIASDGTECDFRGSPGWNPDEECGPLLQEAQQGPEQAVDPNTGLPLVDEDGDPVLVSSAWRTFAMNEWPGGTFDHGDRFFDGGGFQEHYASATGRQGNTNFLVSFSRQHDEGPMLNQRGFERNNFRVNVDQVIRPNVSVSASAFYSRSIQADQEGPLFDLTRMQAGVDLASCEPGVGDTNCLDDPENLLLNVNPTNEESENPLYNLLVVTDEETRGRFLASSNVRYSPAGWLDIDADVSYDRLDQENLNSLPKGYRTIAENPSVNEGNLSISDVVNEALNAGVTASTRFMLTEGIENRTQLRYLYEQEDREANSAGGNQFGATGVVTLTNLNEETLGASSSLTSIRSDGYFLITNFDIYDRYIVDALIRNDGSSLFGADERRQWYGRIAGAWRLGEEPWFTVPAIDELKLRASYGTAGGRPQFAAQYETFSVAGGTIVPITLGNRDLKPEHSAELELGIDMILGGRFDVSATRAITNTENQIISVPQPAFTGFVSQVQNVGTLESKTWEFSLGAQILQTEDLTWSARVLFDQTNSVITELNRPEFRYGVGGQGLGNVFLAREGEELGTFYGPIPARSCADLPTDVTSSCNEFVVNDDGFLVWVGAGGLGTNAWGTTSPDGILWGTPFRGECTDRTSGERTDFCPVGNTLPDFTTGLSSTLQWKGLALYGLIEAVQGFDIYNQPLQWAMFRRNIEQMDQTGVPEGEQKPIGYYDQWYNGFGGLVPNGVFVEDGSFVKVREVSLSFRLGASALTGVPGLQGLSGAALTVSGRNLYTWSDYRGYDAEVGETGGDTGSAALARVDGYNYPNFRTVTFGIELNF